jgi:hypothetical protein
MLTACHSQQASGCMSKEQRQKIRNYGVVGRNEKYRKTILID